MSFMFASRESMKGAHSASFVVPGIESSYPTTDLRNQWKLGAARDQMKV